MAAMSAGGEFVISLDFELYWGVRDTRSIESYGRNILGARDVIPRLLDLFHSEEIACTWATVGFLFFDEKEDLLASLPEMLPAYADARFNPYPYLEKVVGRDERSDPYHFGRSLVRQIAACPRQELATHTFSHYYCLEPGQDAASFDADIKAACDAAKRIFNVNLRSIVFPRNQYEKDYLAICRKHGLITFRGNEDAWMYRARSHNEQSKSIRAARLLDAYLPISGHHAFQPQTVDGMINIPSSRFLRPHSARLRQFESLRIRRITSGMRAAAKAGSAYHLWWHPHNFGVHPDENLRNLRTIIDCYKRLRDSYGMRSFGMGELATQTARAA